MSGDTITTQKLIDYGFAGILGLFICIWAVMVTYENLWGRKKKGKK
jgi:hypothetical protein